MNSGKFQIYLVQLYQQPIKTKSVDTIQTKDTKKANTKEEKKPIVKMTNQNKIDKKKKIIKKTVTKKSIKSKKQYMAHKKAGGSSRNGRDSAGRRRGIKKIGGEVVISGNINVRQRGTKFHPGKNVGCGKDHILYSKVAGKVSFVKKGPKSRQFVNVDPV